MTVVIGCQSKVTSEKEISSTFFFYFAGEVLLDILIFMINEQLRMISMGNFLVSFSL